MAVDIDDVCRDASANQSGQELAMWLSIMFAVYTFISIALSALTIYTSSQIGTESSMMEVREKLCVQRV